jgi:2'-5' RNA ligase
MEERYPKRLFAALELEESIRSALGAYAGKLKPHFAAWRPRWVDPSLYHLTLHFYGECGEVQTRLIRQGLGSCPRLPTAPRIGFSEIGFLPSERCPRVLYLGVSIEPQAAFDPGSGGSKPWKAHLTLARLGSQKSFPPGGKALLPPPPALSFFPRDFALLVSTLSFQGPEYRALERYLLL